MAQNYLKHLRLMVLQVRSLDYRSIQFDTDQRLQFSQKLHSIFLHHNLCNLWNSLILMLLHMYQLGKGSYHSMHLRQHMLHMRDNNNLVDIRAGQYLHILNNNTQKSILGKQLIEVSY
jgi:hypothetical protein